MSVRDLPEEGEQRERSPLELAKSAIGHALFAICDDPRKYWLLGNGTETYARLTAAHAALNGVDVERVRASFQPNRAKYQAFLDRRLAEAQIEWRFPGAGELPDEGTRVLLALESPATGEPIFGYLEGGVWYDDDDNHVNRFGAEVIAWAHTPEPPSRRTIIEAVSSKRMQQGGRS